VLTRPGRRAAPTGRRGFREGRPGPRVRHQPRNLLPISACCTLIAPAHRCTDLTGRRAGAGRTAGARSNAALHGGCPGVPTRSALPPHPLTGPRCDLLWASVRVAVGMPLTGQVGSRGREVVLGCGARAGAVGASAAGGCGSPLIPAGVPPWWCRACVHGRAPAVPARALPPHPAPGPVGDLIRRRFLVASRMPLRRDLGVREGEWDTADAGGAPRALPAKRRWAWDARRESRWSPATVTTQKQRTRRRVEAVGG